LWSRIGGGVASIVLIDVCGRGRFPRFEARRGAAGVQVRPVETYETIAVDYSDDAVLARTAGRPVDALLLYSAKAAEAARNLAARPALQALFADVGIYALSERIAKAWGHEESRLHVAESPVEEALLDRLRGSD